MSRSSLVVGCQICSRGGSKRLARQPELDSKQPGRTAVSTLLTSNCAVFARFLLPGNLVRRGVSGSQRLGCPDSFLAATVVAFCRSCQPLPSGLVTYLYPWVQVRGTQGDPPETRALPALLQPHVLTIVSGEVGPGQRRLRAVRVAVHQC